MCHASNEKQETTHDERNGTNKSRQIRTLEEKETYKYLGISEAGTIKQVKIKQKRKKVYCRRTKKVLETKLYSRNLVKGIDTWAVPLI